MAAPIRPRRYPAYEAGVLWQERQGVHPTVVNDELSLYTCLYISSEDFRGYQTF